LLPRILQKGRQRRIVSIEIHRITSIVTQHSYEECLIRVLSPSKEGKRHRAAKNTKHHQNDEDDDHDDLDADDDESIYTVSPEFLDHGDTTGYSTAPTGTAKDDPMYPGWRPKYCFQIRHLVIKGTRRNSVVVEITLGKKKEVREIVFESLAVAEHFHKIITQEIQKDVERSNSKMLVAMGTDVDKILHLKEEDLVVSFLFEIVSAWDIPVADFTSSDPFVSCIFYGTEVHRTNHISKTLDPIWTVSTGSLFLLRNINIKEQLFRSDGMLCILYDYDKLGANDALGAVTIPPKTIFDAKGERMEFPLGTPPVKCHHKITGNLAIRIRRATQYDIDFMDQLHNHSNQGTITIPGMKGAIELDDHSHFKGGKGNIKSLLTKRSRMPKGATDDSQREYKVRPGPDPKRVEETTWMTQHQLDTECVKESVNWVDVGAGRLGRLFVEILHCDSLPNLDVGGFAGNKTDAFVSIVFEDAVVQTDVVDDTLSPRWLPWTKRAFIFHMLHSSSQLFLGVFDYDAGFNPTDDHDLIGRVSVDLSNLQKDTVYTLNYQLFPTARMAARDKQGNITIRLRLDIPDERKVLLSAIEPPPAIYVNVKTRKEFRVVRYTCTGKYNMEKYSMKIINA
jgi:C2 domain